MLKFLSFATKNSHYDTFYRKLKTWYIRLIIDLIVLK